MDDTAIHAIQQTAIEAERANRLKTDTPAIVLRNALGEQHVESLERFMASRARFRGTYATTAIQDFMAYAVAVNHGHGFIDVEHMAAQVIFNLRDQTGTPGHADDVAVLTLKPTAAFNALIQDTASVASFQQKAFVEWLEDWADYLEPDYDDDGSRPDSDPSYIKRAISAVRKVKIKAGAESVHESADFRSTRSALESIEASADAGLPRGFRFTCQPYDALDIAPFYVRLSVHATDDGKPTFKLRWPHRQRDFESLGQEFKAKLMDGLGTTINMYLGGFNPGPE